MKHIQKGQEPEKFSQWKQRMPKEKRPDFSKWRHKSKKAVKAALMQEQGHICCYCECELLYDDSHIEHFRPKSDPTVDPYDFTNLLCSCQQNIPKGAPRHCGSRKENWFDEPLLISPLDPSCEHHFKFKADGRIEPVNSNDTAAIQTIDRLGLDIPKLRAMRKAAITPFLDEELSAEEVKNFTKHYLQPNEDGHFNPFWTTIRSLFP